MKMEDIKVNTINAFANEIKKIEFNELVAEKDLSTALKDVIARLRDSDACKKYFSKSNFKDKQKLELDLKYIYTKEYFAFIKTTNESAENISGEEVKQILEIAFLVTYISIDTLFESEQEIDPLFGIAMGIIFHVAHQVYCVIGLEDRKFEIFRRLIVSNAVMYMYKCVYKFVINGSDTSEEEKQELIQTISLYVETVVGESSDGIIRYFSTVDKTERQNIFTEYKKKVKFVNYKHFTENWWRLSIDMKIDYLGDVAAVFKTFENFNNKVN